MGYLNLNNVNLGTPNLSGTIKAGGGGNQLANYKAPSPPPPSNQRASTPASSGGNVNRSQPAAPATAQVQPSGNSGGSNNAAPDLPNLDELYQPIFDSYDATQAAMTANRDQNNTDNQSTYESQNSLIPGQEKSLRSSLENYTTQFGNTVNSAYDQAVRDFQAAQQRAIALYGGGNGAGAAMNDLANQEYLRSRNGIGQQELAGKSAFGTQGQDITNWVAQKHSDLDGWLRDAKTQVQGQFTQNLMAINNNRSATTAQKASQKVQLLSDVMAQNNALQLADNNFRRQLVLVQAQAQQIGGKQMDTGGFNSTLNNLFSQLAPYTSGGAQSAKAAGSSGANSFFSGANPSANKNDQFANLIMG